MLKTNISCIINVLVGVCVGGISVNGNVPTSTRQVRHSGPRDRSLSIFFVSFPKGGLLFICFPWVFSFRSVFLGYVHIVEDHDKDWITTTGVSQCTTINQPTNEAIHHSNASSKQTRRSSTWRRRRRQQRELTAMDHDNDIRHWRHTIKSTACALTSSQGEPACLMEDNGDAPVPPSCPETWITSALALATPAATVPMPTSDTWPRIDCMMT